MGSRASSGAAARAAVAAVVACTLLVLLLAVWAASTGPGEVLRGDGPDRLTLPSSTPTSPSAADLGPPADRPPPRTEETSPLLGLLATVLVVLLGGALALGLVAGAVLTARYLWRLRPSTGEAREHVDFDVLDGSSREALRQALLADRDEQRRALTRGSPRNAVVATWRRVETLAAEAGVAPRASETSTELALRVLDLVGADGAAVTALAEEFRAARFSRREVDEAARARALALLDDLHAGLAARPGAQSGAGRGAGSGAPTGVPS